MLMMVDVPRLGHYNRTGRSVKKQSVFGAIALTTTEAFWHTSLEYETGGVAMSEEV
jgi:hypothetical protein